MGDDRSEARAAMLESFSFVMKVKAEMVAAGETSAERQCPRCGRQVRFRLVPARSGQQHVRAACETPGCIGAIE